MCVSRRDTPVGPCLNRRYLTAFAWRGIGDMLTLECGLYGLCEWNNLVGVPDLLANFEIAQRVAYGPADISLLLSARIFLSDCIRKCVDIHSAYIPFQGQALQGESNERIHERIQLCKANIDATDRIRAPLEFPHI